MPVVTISAQTTQGKIERTFSFKSNGQNGVEINGLNFSTSNPSFSITQRNSID